MMPMLTIFTKNIAKTNKKLIREPWAKHHQCKRQVLKLPFFFYKLST